MKYTISAFLSLTLVFSALAGPPTHDASAIQGVWVPVKAEIGGEVMKKDFLLHTIMRLKNGNYNDVVAGAPDKGTYALGESLRPKIIDITGKEGPNAGKTMPGIYELDDNRLKICYALHGGERPKEFKSPAGSDYFFVIYERKKTKVAE